MPLQNDMQISRIGWRWKERGMPQFRISVPCQKGVCPQSRISVPCQNPVTTHAIKIKELKESHIIIHNKSCTICHNI